MPYRIDFEDTYDGLGDQLNDEQDAFNDDTFGGGGGGLDTDGRPVGRDFDFFGKTAQVADAFEEEQVRYNLQHPPPASTSAATEEAKENITTAPIPEPQPRRTGYEKYNDPGYIPDLQAKSSVWGLSKEPMEPTAQGPSTKRMLSLEEVEAQLRQSSGAPLPQPPMSMPPPHFRTSVPTPADASAARNICPHSSGDLAGPIGQGGSASAVIAAFPPAYDSRAVSSACASSPWHTVASFAKCQLPPTYDAPPPAPCNAPAHATTTAATAAATTAAAGSTRCQ